MLRIGRVAMGLLVLAALAGCVGGEATPSPEGDALTASPTSRPSPTSAPPPSPVATGTSTPVVEPEPPRPSEWVIAPDAVGPLVLGDDMQAVNQTIDRFDGVELVYRCAGIASFTLDGVEVSVVFTPPEYRQLTGIVVRGASPPTVEGIRIGSTLADARTAYPGALEYKIYDTPILAVTAPGGPTTSFLGGPGDETITTITLNQFAVLAYDSCG